jgi:hypothetical protein
VTYPEPFGLFHYQTSSPESRCSATTCEWKPTKINLSTMLAPQRNGVSWPRTRIRSTHPPQQVIDTVLAIRQFIGRECHPFRMLLLWGIEAPEIPCAENTHDTALIRLA